MEQNKRKPLLHSQVSGFYVPAKFRMNQRHNKRPGKPKVFTRDEIDRYLEEQECGKAQSHREDGEDLVRHCGPNFRRFSDYELMQFMPPKKLKKTSEDEIPDGEAADGDAEQGGPDDDENLNDEDFDYEDDDEDSQDAETQGQEEKRQAQAIGMRLLWI